jgi:hypothetical protein
MTQAPSKHQALANLLTALSLVTLVEWLVLAGITAVSLAACAFAGFEVGRFDVQHQINIAKEELLAVIHGLRQENTGLLEKQLTLHKQLEELSVARPRQPADSRPSGHGLGGVWSSTIDGKVFQHSCLILETPSGLLLVNERGIPAIGDLSDDGKTLTARDNVGWHNARGVIERDGRAIKWDTATTWTKESPQ